MNMDSSSGATFWLDGDELPFEPGDSVLEAATRAGRYIPHLCWQPGYAPHGWPGQAGRSENWLVKWQTPIFDSRQNVSNCWPDRQLVYRQND